MLATYMWCMRNNNLQIRIVGSSNVARNNPLNPKSDPYQLSPNKISTSPAENILRIDKTDHQREMLWSLIKLS